MLNDDFTPQGFVVMVLQQFSAADLEARRASCLTIHHEGARRVRTVRATSPRPKLKSSPGWPAGVSHPLQCIMGNLP